MGSEAAIIEKAMMSADSISMVRKAMGSTTPRWHRMIFVKRETSIESSLHMVPQPDHHFHGSPLVCVGIAGYGLLGAGHELQPDRTHVAGHRGGGPGVRGAVVSREVCQVERDDSADEWRGDAARYPIDHRAGELVLDGAAVSIHECDVGSARDEVHGLRRAQLAAHELEGPPPVLLRLDAVGADEVGLLALHLHGQESRQHESQKCDDDQQLRQAESALVASEREHGLHL